jgi:glucosamine--fructose-6-phosphate aminotransferase (isomerizing)
MNVPPGSHTYHEIVGQGEAWVATLAAVSAQAAELADWLRRPRAEVLFTGCGSTYYLSLTAAATWQAVTGIRAWAAPASEVWLFPSSTLPAQPSLLVAVSRSAETTETLRAVEVYQARTGGDWLAVTCYANRELTDRASQALVARLAGEDSVAQTRSFTSMLVLTQVAAGLAAGRDDYLAELRTLPHHVGRVILDYERLAQALANDPRLERFVFLGSGPNYGLAREAMLKMKEMSLSPSEAFHFLEFRHGPKSVVAPGTLIVGLVSDTARQQETAVLAEMRDLGASVLAVAESDGGLPADYVVELRSGLDGLARGALVLPVLQLMACYRALARGLDPDRPTHLEAVVRLNP